MENTALSVDDSLLAICLFAAFADGEKCDAEREAVRRIAGELKSESLTALSRQILMRKLSLEAAVAGLGTREERMLAYEMALGICEAGGSVTTEEQGFLDELRGNLRLGEGEAKEMEAEVASVALQPLPVAPPALPAPPAAVDNSGTILKYAIVNGALELLPESLATMAIVPLQMKMVHGIGQSHGVELDRGHIKEFLAAAGIGLGSQVVEGFARKLMGGLGKKMLGKLGGKVAGQITGSAFSFASTYAIGHVAEKYYAGGRRLDRQGMQQLFDSLQVQARELHGRYLPQIQERARTLDTGSLLSMVSKGV